MRTGPKHELVGGRTMPTHHIHPFQSGQVYQGRNRHTVLLDAKQEGAVYSQTKGEEGLVRAARRTERTRPAFHQARPDTATHNTLPLLRYVKGRIAMDMLLVI